MAGDVKTIEPFKGPIPEEERGDRPIPVDVQGVVDTREKPDRKPRVEPIELANAEPAVLPANKRRRAGVLLNTGTLTVYVVADRTTASQADTRGFPLDPGVSLRIGHQAEVVVACPTATAATRGRAVLYSEVDAS